MRVPPASPPRSSSGTASPAAGTVARLRVSDTQRLGWVEVRIPADTPLPFSSAIEFAVEELATTIPAVGRLDALERLSPLLWTGRGVE